MPRTTTMKLTTNTRRPPLLPAFDIQALEARMLMASDPLGVTLAKGALTINGSKFDDSIVVSVSGNAWTVTNGSWSITKTGAATKLTVNGKLGNDTITIDSSVTIAANLIGDVGNDNITASSGASTLTGNAGNDTLTGGSGNDSILGGAGADSMTGNGGIDTISYTDHTVLQGITLNLGFDSTAGMTGENDFIAGDFEIARGGAGHDSINASMDGSTIYGGAGNDTLNGSLGNDYLNAEAGNDSVNGSLGNDTLLGGAGNDSLDGSLGDDSILGEAGNDSLNGSLDNDYLNGGAGNDSVYGSLGNDALYGDAGNDLLEGGLDNDSLYGGAGNDSMAGGLGDDLLISIGGGNIDTLSGGLDTDTFWTDAVVTETITDADSGELVQRVSAFANKASKELTGQNLADPAVTSKTIKYRNFKNNPIFSGSGPSINDIRQGGLGDCYFLAQIGSLAKLDPTLIRQSIINLGDGTFAVQLNKGVNKTYYRIDADLPSTSASSLAYAQFGASSSTWVALFEKAWAFARSGKNTYASIASGFMTEVAGAFGKSATWGWSTANGVLANLQSQLAAGKSVTAGTFGSQPQGSLLVGGHAYSVESITDDGAGGHTVVVRNPWAVDGYTIADGNNDGYVTLTGTQFVTWMQTFAVCDA